MRRFVIRVLMAVLFRICFSAHAQDKQALIKVGGDFRVASIERAQNGKFSILFENSSKTGRFDKLILSSDHVHVGIKQGATIRLSAEVFLEKGSIAEVSQMVIFIPNRIGAIPVWLLSNKYVGRDLNAADYLKMHVPQADYVVM